MRLNVFFLIGLYSFCLAAQTPSTTHNQPEAPKSIHQLFLDDQEDLPSQANGGVSRITEQEFNVRGTARRAQVRAMLERDEAKTWEDFYDAAFLFQHGETADDYLFAQVLAVDAVIKGYDTAKWIAAATLDRYLQLTNKPQVFGTQYPLDSSAPQLAGDPHADRLSGRTQAPYNGHLLPDSLRLDFCVPSLAQQKENLATFNAGKRPERTMVDPAGNDRTGSSS